MYQLSVVLSKKYFSGRETETNMKKKKLFGLLVGLVFSMAVFSGCDSSNSNVTPMYGDSAEIKIAILGADKQFSAREDFLIGMDLAIRELEAQNIKVSYEKLDDGHSRDNGIALATEVAHDSAYTMAFTMQSADVVDTIAEIFEEAEKPLLIVNEVLYPTMNKGQEYVLAGVVSAEAKGKALTKYCEKNGIKWVAAAHSDTQYEKIFARNFTDETMASKNVNMVDSFSGPNSMGDILDMYNRWNILGVQAALFTFDDLEWACEVISNIKAQNKDILIFGDYSYNDKTILNKYGETLDGLIAVGPMGVPSTENLQAFYDKYDNIAESEYNMGLDSFSALGYDFIQMIAHNVKKSSNAQEFMKNMKSSEGYEGVTGVKFNKKGQLDEEPDFFIVRDGKTWRID